MHLIVLTFRSQVAGYKKHTHLIRIRLQAKPRKLTLGYDSLGLDLRTYQINHLHVASRGSWEVLTIAPRLARDHLSNNAILRGILIKLLFAIKFDVRPEASPV